MVRNIKNSTTWNFFIKKNLDIIFLYTLLYVIFAWIIFSQFGNVGKSLIQLGNDSFSQTFSYLGFLGKYLRTIAFGFFSGQGLQIPLFDLRFGLGDDILTSLAHYGIANPVMLLFSALTPMLKTETLFNCIVYFQLYLVGLSFICYCLYMKTGKLAALCGSLVYISSGFPLFYAVRHYFFVVPMIVIPIIFIGLEKAMRADKLYVLIISVMFTFMINFYFFFMITIYIAIYVFLRFFEIYKTDRLKNFAFVLGRSIGGYLIGVLLSSIVVVPSILSFLQSGRTYQIIPKDGLFFFPTKAIIYNFLYMFAPSARWGRACVVPICLISLALFLFKNRKYSSLKTSFILISMGFIIPGISFALNAFNYVTDRWSFIVPFVFAYMFAKTFPQLVDLTAKEKTLCASMSAFYFVWLLLLAQYSDKLNVYFMYSLAIISITAAVMCINWQWKYAAALKSIFMVVMVITCASLNGVFMYSTQYGNYVSDTFGNKGEILERMDQSPVLSLETIQDDGFYRSDATLDATTNTHMRTNSNGLSGYWSFMKETITAPLIDLEASPGIRHVISFHGLDQRAALMELANVKYFAVLTDKENYAPYGYKKISTDYRNDKEYSIFQNEYFIPFGYTYDNYITSDEYARLSSLDKQEAMLQSVVLENEVPGYEKNTDLKFSSTSIPFEMKQEGLTWQDGVVDIKDSSKASLQITFDSVANAEHYLRFESLDLNGASIGWLAVMTTATGVSKRFDVFSDTAPFYCGIENYMVNMGKMDEGKESQFTVTFTAKGKFKLKSIQVFANPMDNYGLQTQQLGKNALESLQWGTNSFSGNVNIDSKKIVCFSIPYSTGWTAYINGVKTPILKANEMYCAVPLDAGLNIIELKYITPGLKQGAALSGMGFLFFIGLTIYYKKRARIG